MKDADKRWQCEAEIRIVKSYTKSGQTKLNYVETLVARLNDQVIRAPHKVTDADVDTSEARLYKARDIESKFEDSREAFDRWVSWYMQTLETFNNLTGVKTPKDEDTEETEDRDRRRPRYEDKGSTTDAKGLKPDVLDTSMPQLTIKNWFTCWDNYKHASGWGQGENHKTQMAYLRMCLSEEIRTAIDFNNIRTVDKAIFDIRAYMTSSVMPLTLQRLDLFQYSHLKVNHKVPPLKQWWK